MNNIIEKKLFNIKNSLSLLFFKIVNGITFNDKIDDLENCWKYLLCHRTYSTREKQRTAIV